jgi:nitroreductase
MFPECLQEDYAATCCSIQNMMLALHSQGVGSKWTTGAVTRTKEIADLIGYSLDEVRPKMQQVLPWWYSVVSSVAWFGA